MEAIWNLGEPSKLGEYKMERISRSIKKVKKLVIHDGQLTGVGTLILGLIGISLVFYTLLIAENLLFGTISIVLGLLCLGIASTANNAASIKLKPFTNDPLGWRKAKESYKKEEVDVKKSTDSDKEK